MLPLSTGMAVLAGLGLGVLGVLWAFYERRERQGGAAARPSAHHCLARVSSAGRLP